VNGGIKNTDLVNRVDFVEEALYEVRRKIYPRAVSGWFARWRLAMVFLTQIVFYGAPWLPWNERQSVLFDLAARKFYIFGLVFWPQDFIYLTALLVISALSLFLFTAVAGRLWCGHICPQTVYTEIFLWIERKVEGSRAHQMKLDQGAFGLQKFRLKALKHGIWIVFSLWTGFTFVGYFTPIRQLAGEVAAFGLGPWEMFWVLFYGFATYGNAGWMREQVCIHMCPYARFQSAMFDSDTMIITYDRARGEPRGARSRAADPKTSGLGDCIDCSICVQVCPTGIDIREGLQYECIGCAACIDGCNQVMKKMGYAPGLIRYSTENALRHGWNFTEMMKRAFRPRVLLYAGILWAIIIGTGAALFLRVPLKVDVIRDRASLAREMEDGKIENVYRLQVMNTEEKSHRFVITVKGPDDLQHLEILSDLQPLEIGPVSSRIISVRVRAEPEHAERGTEHIDFIIEASDDEKHLLPEIFSVREKSSFFIPGNSR
jgi:cytochrome c oxidase accessory protein FixG